MSLDIENALRVEFYDITKKGGIGDLIRNLRTTTTALDRRALVRRFQELGSWQKVKKSSGHMEFKNRLWGDTVSFQNHPGVRNEFVLSLDHRSQLLEVLQKHVNFFGNEVFAFTKHNWKYEPDFKKAAERFESLN